jgi:DNA-binding transcriptional LysR family regulator
MQIKRLEELLALQLLDRSGRKVTLTAAGEQFLAYARRMVEMNDEVFAKLTDQAYEGELLLGVPHDIVYPVIPQVLQRFNAEYPRMKVQLVSSYTSNLTEQFRRGEIDVILTTESGLGEGGETLVEVPLRWVGAPSGSAWRHRPLRLAFCRFCLFRPGALSALDANDISWEIAVESDNDRTVEATVSADLAITAMLEGHAPPYLEHIPVAGSDLPELGRMRINLYGNAAQPEMVSQLKSMIRQGFGAP